MDGVIMELKKCIIYSRVSTAKQDNENQTLRLKEYAERKYEIVDIVEEIESTRNIRQKLNAVLNRNDYDVLIVYALDRVSRNGLFETISILKNLTDRGITFESYSEPLLNTGNELVSNILLTVLSSLANMERQKISERTKLGLAKAVKDGKQLGRPEKAISNDRLNKIKEMRAQGIGYGTIGESVKLKRGRVQYICQKNNFTTTVSENIAV